MSQIYKVNFKDINILAVRDFTHKRTIMPLANKYIYPYGFCKVINIDDLDDDEIISITSQKRAKVIIKDYYTANDILINENPTFTADLSTETAFDYSHYLINYEVYDRRIRNSIDCKDYTENYNNSQCISSTMIENLILWFGCVPPWVMVDNQTKCEDKVKDFYKYNPTLAKDIAFNLYSYLALQKVFSKCKIPCLRSKIQLIRKEYHANELNYSTLNLVWPSQVNVYTEVYSIGFFSLVVELGSALGLWLGLSALSILDLLYLQLEIIANCSKNTCKNKVIGIIQNPI